MPRLLRAAAFLAGVSVLYVAGYVAMTSTPPPWGLLWLPPLAVVAGVAWYLLERLDARLLRRARDRAERDSEPRVREGG
jgi:peptidoglycan/LPS O-acetylase OafA/YrhL